MKENTTIGETYDCHKRNVRFFSIAKNRKTDYLTLMNDHYAKLIETSPSQMAAVACDYKNARSR